MPSSNGVAIQFIDSPDKPLSVLNPNNVLTVDTDTCDFSTNPLCAFDNYPLNGNAGASRNIYREMRCNQTPYPYYCKPSRSINFATDNAEILAYYDGSAPIFALYDETNPSGGINLTYQVRGCPQRAPTRGVA